MRHRRLDHEPARPGVEGLAHHFLGVVLRKDQNLRIGKIAANHSRGFQTVEVWHADIHDDKVRMKLVGFLDSILPVYGFPANFAIPPCRQQRANAPANYFVIVRYQNPHSVCPFESACKILPS